MKFCGGCGRPLAGADPGNAGQRRHMTVMFCDMVGSTSLAESLDPEDFREILTAYQHACARAVERYDGWIAQWAGDGLLAYFGYPRAHEDDAHRAVHAGLAIIEELARLNARLSVALQVRVGLHSGIVIAGETGTGDARLQRGIVGKTPHVAARIEAIAAPGTVVISDSTRELIDDYFELEGLGEKALRGVARPIGVYRVLRFTGAVGRLDVGGPRPLKPMVGRDAELGRLEAAWGQAASGQGAIVHIPGEAGIGKSRLVRALTEKVGAAQVWQCSAHHRSTSLYPVIRYLEGRLELDRADQLHRLNHAVLAAGLEPHEAVPLLADLLAVGGEARPALSPVDARTATLRVLEALLVADPAQHPLLLVIEDLHWADPTTVELLGRIAVGLQNIPVLCVATYRPEFEPPWPCELTVELGRLAPDAVRAIVAASGLDTDLSVADGVPLFVEELLKMLAHEGPREREQGESAASVVPPTLQGLLTHRLDRLPELGDVIDVAAVLGREFERERLAALVPVNGALTRLAEQDVIRPVHGAPGRYEFKHALLHDAAYARLLRRRRQTLHARVAELLAGGLLAEREPEGVARHWSRAGEPAKAVPYWQAAGERALDRAAFLEAVDHFRRGLAALDKAGPGAGDRAELLIYLAASLQAGVGYAAPGVDEAYAEAKRHATGDRLQSITRGQWSFHLLRARYGEALEFADEVLTTAERTGDPERLADGHMRRGMVHMYRAEFELARAHLTEAYARYERPKYSSRIYDAQGDIAAQALAYLAIVLWNLGHAEEAQARSDRSLELAERDGGPVTLAQVWGMRALLHFARLEPAEFAHWTQKTHAQSVDRSLGYWRSLSAMLAGWLQARGGELEAGSELVDASLEAYMRAGNRLGLSRFYVMQADLRLLAGDRASAFAAIRTAEQHVEQTGERYSEAELFRFKGRMLMDGDPEGATAAFEHAVAAARAQHATLLELRSATQLAEHQRTLGATCTTLARVAELLERFPAGLELPDLVQARALLGAKMTAS